MFSILSLFPGIVSPKRSADKILLAVESRNHSLFIFHQSIHVREITYCWHVSVERNTQLKEVRKSWQRTFYTYSVLCVLYDI
jgi:hypothetical protein